MTPQPTKIELRRTAKERIQALSGERRSEFDREIINFLRADPRYATAKTVLGYASLADEVCLDDLWSFAVREGKRVLLPKMSANEDLVFSAWDETEAMEEGACGVREPQGPPVEPTSSSLILIPGRAFDVSGRRTGRGGGHYDRVLPRLRSLGPIVGVAYRCQVFERIPGEAHDVPVDDIVTERGFVRERSSTP